MALPSAAVRRAEASMPAVRVPGLGKEITTSKQLEPSGVMKFTLWTASTLASPMVDMVAGTVTVTGWPT